MTKSAPQRKLLVLAAVVLWMVVNGPNASGQATLPAPATGPTVNVSPVVPPGGAGGGGDGGGGGETPTWLVYLGIVGIAGSCLGALALQVLLWLGRRAAENAAHELKILHGTPVGYSELEREYHNRLKTLTDPAERLQAQEEFIRQRRRLERKERRFRLRRA